MPITLGSIKENLDNRLGKNILLTVQTGRKKKTERKGILADTYHSVFVVELDQEENAFERVSYSYTDVLTHAVEIEFINETCPQFA